ncbi:MULTISPECIES: histidinol-phosphate transaminase [Desulfitobacterium]|uniref:Aminotransferase n=1 Tax=Desulfitobacterium dehalogenans (strain ATCC 51507 / DSM 9161 / JW/IU-DC1) TaxID=756499 RepID=I4A6T6_DESDJ|nr:MULTISPECIES: threonine-phosphate decarboxylase [Desulfitobacterium]AFL99670.1 PLP-dependent enzyme, histidinol-phosphate/aromatic aminotransferase or cobyric acid decarboxylase [Desulfitobacterium dehalogenans ATCC 51507]
MHGGNLLEASVQYGRQNFIDLSANINPFGPPQGVWEALQKGIKSITHYPDPKYRRLRGRMAEYYALTDEEILLGNGAGELIFLILHGLRPRKVLIPQPAFSEYGRAALACGAEVSKMILGVEGWGALSFQNEETYRKWEQALAENELVFINSPHNPTGSALTKKQFEVILNLALKHKTWVVLDESFVDFMEDRIRWSGREYLRRYPNLLVLYSLTKFYAIPGLRLGAVFAAPKLLNRLQEQRDPWAVNCLAEEAGIAALADAEYGKRVRFLLEESKESFYQNFAEGSKEQKFLGLRLYSSKVNFALIQVLGVEDSILDLVEAERRKKIILQKLGRQGILVRDCENFQGLEGKYIRVAIKDRESMNSLLIGLKTLES